jgi:hypothetical protein
VGFEAVEIIFDLVRAEESEVGVNGAPKAGAGWLR